MPVFAAITLWGWILTGVLLVLSLIMMFIVLIQRGKGGGLAGAFGGPGGSSAFGSRAGDAFTKITLYLAAIWVLVIMIAVKVFDDRSDGITDTAQTPAPTAPADPQP
ncbi:MAG: preprotein translocase subunit SecG [Fimbriiglobus sp.]|nr:preprotein translocase subunit SecG [Fimbriiglobus sp.]